MYTHKYTTLLNQNKSQVFCKEMNDSKKSIIRSNSLFSLLSFFVSSMPGELYLPLSSPLPGGALRVSPCGIHALLETCAPTVVQILTVALFARHLKENLTSLCILLACSVVTFPHRAKATLCVIFSGCCVVKSIPQCAV